MKFFPINNHSLSEDGNVSKNRTSHSENRSTVPPFSLTPISVQNTFTIPGIGGCPATVVDIDGNVYNNVAIGSQCWMAENLKATRYQDGSLIATGLPDEVWSSTSIGAYSLYDNSALSGMTYGALYNWFAVADPRGLCPAGWHVPSSAEWTVLTDELGGEVLAGGLKAPPKRAPLKSSKFGGRR